MMIQPANHYTGFTFPIAQKQVAFFVHNRQDQEDLLQTIFIKIFEQLHTLKEPGKYPGWAKMIARNTCMDYGLRSQIRK